MTRDHLSVGRRALGPRGLREQPGQKIEPLLRGRWVFYGLLRWRRKTRPGAARWRPLGHVRRAEVLLTTMRRHVGKRIRRMAGS